MTALKVSKKRFMRDLTRTRHMTTVSAVVLGTIFMPLLGIPEMYEVQAFQNAVDGMTAPPSARRDDEAARQRSAAVVAGEQPREETPWERLTLRQRDVESPRIEAPDEERLVEMIAPDAPLEPVPVAEVDENPSAADIDEASPAIEELQPLAGEDAAPEIESEMASPEIDEPEKREEPVADDNAT